MRVSATNYFHLSMSCERRNGCITSYENVNNCCIRIPVSELAILFVEQVFKLGRLHHRWAPIAFIAQSHKCTQVMCGGHAKHPELCQVVSACRSSYSTIANLLQRIAQFTAQSTDTIISQENRYAKRLISTAERSAHSIIVTRQQRI